MRFRFERVIPIIVGLGCLTLSVRARAQDNNAYLYIAHAASGRNISSTGNPEFPIDISFNGFCVVKGESFGEIKGPFAGGAGTYTFQVSMANTGTPCGNPAIYTAQAPVSASIAYLGIITLDANNNIVGQLIPIDLSSIPAGQGRIVVANSTPETLTAKITDSSGVSATETVGGQADVATYAPSGEYTGSIYINGASTPSVGPVNAEIASRDLYLYVIAGSSTNQSLQLIGPKVIRDVF